MKSITLFIFLSISIKLAYCQYPSNTEKPYITIEVENPIPFIRNNETITLSGRLVRESFPNQNVKFIKVKDLKSNKFLITQSVDSNDDGIIDAFLFQSDFRSNEKKEFALSLEKKKSTSPSKVHAAFMATEEGMEDFTWENDFIGYRFYGQERAKKQGTGIAMDIWCKRLSELLTDKWYAPEQNYHKDKGYGADHYSSGKNQGCGGTGIALNDSLYFSKPFSDWKIIANGPIRVVFELKFRGFSMNDSIIETKRVTLDAGHYFNKIESSYSPDTSSQDYLHAVGFVQRDDSETRIEKEKGWIASWESLGESKGNLGTGFIASPDDISKIEIQNKHVVSFMYPKSNTKITYYTGASWSEFGTLNSNKQWVNFIKNRTICIFNPCSVVIKK